VIVGRTEDGLFTLSEWVQRSLQTALAVGEYPNRKSGNSPCKESALLQGV
jgi:hypothetical protein